MPSASPLWPPPAAARPGLMAPRSDSMALPASAPGELRGALGRLIYFCAGGGSDGNDQWVCCRRWQNDALGIYPQSMLAARVSGHERSPVTTTLASLSTVRWSSAVDSAIKPTGSAQASPTRPQQPSAVSGLGGRRYGRCALVPRVRAAHPRPSSAADGDARESQSGPSRLVARVYGT